MDQTVKQANQSRERTAGAQLLSYSQMSQTWERKGLAVMPCPTALMGIVDTVGSGSARLGEALLSSFVLQVLWSKTTVLWVRTDSQ